MIIKKSIECTNRFQILQECDNVVSEQACDPINTTHAYTHANPVASPKLGLTYAKASQSEDLTRINWRTSQKGKQNVKSNQVEVKHHGCQDTQAQKPKGTLLSNRSTGKKVRMRA